jgi:hypothetical protein
VDDQFPTPKKVNMAGRRLEVDRGNFPEQLGGRADWEVGGRSIGTSQMWLHVDDDDGRDHMNTSCARSGSGLSPPRASVNLAGNVWIEWNQTID